MPTPPVTAEQVRALYDRPLLQLIDQARQAHLLHFPDNEVQLCTLLSVKTGGCPEDCSYCPQSSKYETEVGGAERMLDIERVLSDARRARALGSTRFCMGAAWREVKDGPAFDRVDEGAVVGDVDGGGAGGDRGLGDAPDRRAAVEAVAGAGQKAQARRAA